MCRTILRLPTPGGKRRWTCADGMTSLCSAGDGVRSGVEVRGETLRGVCDWGRPGRGQRVTPQGRLRIGRYSEVSVLHGSAGFGCTCVCQSTHRHGLF